MRAPDNSFWAQLVGRPASGVEAGVDIPKTLQERQPAKRSLGLGREPQDGLMGEADQSCRLGATFNPGHGKVHGLRHHRLPRDADGGEPQAFGDGGVVEADEGRSRATLLPAIRKQSLGQTVIAGENPGGLEFHNPLGAG